MKFSNKKTLILYSTKEKIKYTKEIYKDKSISVQYSFDEDNKLTKVTIINKERLKSLKQDGTVLLLSGETEKIKSVYQDNIIKVLKANSKTKEISNYIISIL